MLGSVFEYPQILEEPTADILALFREHQGAVTRWFLVLVIERRPDGPRRHLARPHRRRDPRPLDRRRRHRRRHRAGRRAATLGHARPGISKDALDPARRADAEDRFELLHTLLGKVIGETIGYALTATFTVLVVIALRRTDPADLARLHRLRSRPP